MNLKSISINFRLFDESNSPVDNLEVEVQYFDGNTDKWISFAHSTVVNGQLAIKLVPPLPRQVPTLPRQVLLPMQNLWKMLEGKNQPSLRIAVKNNLHQTEKPEILAIAYDRVLNIRTHQLNFNFGEGWLVPGNMLTEIDRFADFILVGAPNKTVSDIANVAKIKRLENELIAVNKLLADKEKKILKLDNIKVEFDSLKAVNKDLKQKLKNITSNNDDLRKKNLDLGNRIKATEDELAGVNIKLNTVLKDNQVITIDRDSLLDRIKDLEKQGSLDERPIALSSFSSKIIDEFEKTDIANQGRSYRLANVSLNLKTVVTKDTNDQLGIQLLPLDKLKEITRDLMSEVHFEFSPGPQKTYESLIVPDLVGLTETAARRILGHLGLQLNPVYQENKKVQGGDSFNQAPEPGSKIMPNDYVTVIFCKK